MVKKDEITKKSVIESALEKLGKELDVKEDEAAGTGVTVEKQQLVSYSYLFLRSYLVPLTLSRNECNIFV